MKTLIPILLFCLIAGSSWSQDVQRYAYFAPASQTITLYRTGTDGFQYCFALPVASLTSDQQSAVSSALGWLSSQLVSTEVLTQAILEPSIDSGTTGLHASITGVRPDGSRRTLSIDGNAVPADVLSGLVAVWTSLAAMPQPTPAP